MFVEKCLIAEILLNVSQILIDFGKKLVDFMGFVFETLKIVHKFNIPLNYFIFTESF
jgi:hypothetical protein